jgi:hypothetical protein
MLQRSELTDVVVGAVGAVRGVDVLCLSSYSEEVFQVFRSSGGYVGMIVR